MSDVKRWYIGVYDGEAQARVCAPHPHEFIRDTEGEIFVLAEQFDACEARNRALQQRLTAADERADNRDSEIFAQVQSALRRSFSLGQIYWQQADSDSTYRQNKSDQTMEVQEQHILNVLKSLGAALKPAEVGADSCEFCKGWGFRSNPDGADEGCGACNGTGKEPSDDQQ